MMRAIQHSKYCTRFETKRGLTLAELSAHLATEGVEQVCGRRKVGNLHVAVLVLALQLVVGREDAGIFVAELQVAFNTSGRVLGALSVVSMGQGHDEARSLHPLDLTRRDKLVDDALRVVGKVAELRLPHDEGIGRRERVPILEAEDAKLAEGRVGDDKLALVLADVLQRGVGVLALLVVEARMPLRESSTLNILARDANVVALGDQRAEGHGLGRGEVNVLAFEDRLGAVGEDTLEVAVNVEAFRGGPDDFTNVPKRLLVHRGGVVREDLGRQLLGRLEAVPGRSGPLLGGGLVVFGLCEALIEHTPHPLLVFFDILLGKGAVLEQLVNVNAHLGVLFADALVHERLSEGGLIRLVVAMLPVAYQVNYHVVLELGTPVGRELADKVDSLDVVSIDVEDGGVNGLGNVSAVGGGTSETGIGGESNLVVDDQVDGAAGGIRGERVHAETLVDDTLCGKSGVAVQEDTHCGAVRLLVVVVVLDGTGLSEHNRILGFQMGRVGDQGQLHALPRGSRPFKVHTKMVLDVARALFLGSRRAGELAEDRLVGFPDDVAENVEPTTMGHADDDVLDSVVDTAVDEGLHSGNQSLASFQTEALVVGVFRRKERFEAGAPDQTIEDTALLVNRVLERLRHL